MSASKLPFANASAGDLFGLAIASSANGQVVIVGAPGQNGAHENDGSAQVFTWNGTDWVQRGASLSGFVPAQFGSAGAAVAISDDGTTVAFVGEGSNTAWVYRWDGTAWVARGSAVANAGSETIALSADGNTLVVADALSSASASMNGAVRVYSWSGSDWAARGAVVTTAPSPDRIQFGWSVDMADDGLSFIVGAPNEGVGGAGGAGAAHVYAWNGTAWAQRGATLAATDAVTNEHYGQAVAMSADGKVVALTTTLDNGGKGGALVFAWSGSAWVQRGGAVLPADAQASDHFGAAVDLSADGATLILGGAWDTVGGNAGQGSARVFDWNGTAWAQRGGALTPADGAGNDLFGSAVSLSEDGLVAFVGGPYDDTNNQDVGTARSFYWNGTAWLETGPTALLSVAASSASVIEGSGGTRDVTFTVTRSGVTTSAASASWSVTGTYTWTDAHPADANDFAGGVLPSGTVSFAAGETSKTITVTLNSDAAIEGDDVFTLSLSSPVNAVLASSAYALGPASAQVTIVDDDTAISTRSGWFSRPEGNSGTVEFGFNIDRAGVTTGTSTVQWAVAGSGANPANAADFAGGVLPSGSVTFAPGEVLKVVYVSVAGDTTFEPDETFSLTLSGATGATLGTATASTIIANDDASLSIAATSASKAEGNSGTTDFTFTVTRTGATAGASSASWTVGGGSGATANAADFVGGAWPSGTVSFTAGETSKTITVKVAGDGVTEVDENFTVTLSSPVGASLGTATATGTILNDDTGILFYPYAASKAEGSGGETVFQIEVDRTGVTTGTSSVDWAIQGSGANPATGADFAGGVLPSGSVTFAPGESVKVLDITVAADRLLEPDETFILVASNLVNAELRGTPGTFTIVNDDASLSIAATGASKAEGNGSTTDFTFTVTREGASTGAVSAAWAVTGSGPNPANAADFAGGVLPSGTVNLAAGETSKTITVQVAADAVLEVDEGFTVTLSSPGGASLGTASATGSILNDDSVVSIAAAGASRTEGSGLDDEGDPLTTDFTFTLTRSGALTGASSVVWAVTGSGPNPASAADFPGGVLPSGGMNFSAGETTKTITVKVLADSLAETDEGFTITLSGPIGTSLGTASATGTILDGDVGLSIAAAGASKAEGDAGGTDFTFTVTRTGSSAAAASAAWAVAGSGANPASGADFLGGTLPSGTVNFAAGETSKTITIRVAGDRALEPDEDFAVTLSNPVGAALGTASATGTILHDDATFSLSPGVRVIEGTGTDSGLLLTVTRAGATGTAGSVAYSVAGSGQDPADAGDFAGGALPGGTVTFAAGETSKTIAIRIAGDSMAEPDEGFTVSLSSPVGGSIADGSATFAIVSDDVWGSIVTPADAPANAWFSTTIATSANGLTVVGTTANEGDRQGSARVFDWDGAAWVQRGAPITPADGAANDRFNAADLSADGNTVILGGYLDDVGSRVDQGSARVFDWNGSAWVQRGELLTLAGGSTVGRSVSISADGKVAAVDAGGTTLVFAWNGTGWVQRGVAVGALTSAVSLSADGGVLLIGSAEEGMPSAYNPSFIAPSVGAARAYAWNGSAWVQRGDKLLGETFALDLFGVSVDLSDDGMTAIVGGSPLTSRIGTAAVFHWNGAGWVQQGGALSFADAEPNSAFGVATALSADGRTAIVGGHYDDVNGNADQGSARVFDWNGTAWVQRGAPLTPSDGEALDSFGVSVALSDDGDIAFVGSQVDDVGAHADQGSIRVFVWNGGSWLQTAPGAYLSVAAATPSQAEGAPGETAYSFTVTRSGLVRTAASVNWAVTGSGAHPADAADFAGGILPTGTVSFAAGETSKTITVRLAGDYAVEPDEGFTLTLSGAVGAQIVKGAATAAILNDDAASFSIAATDAVLEEGTFIDPDFTFTVTRTDSAGVASVAWAVTGSGTHAADATDFLGGILPAGTVTFADGETSRTITVSVQHDALKEFDEGFTVTLSNPVGAPIAVATATGTILDDDAPFTGSDGDDTLMGSEGTDIMTGGSGNDTYLINETSDQILEEPGGGADTAFVLINDWTWSPNVEIARLTGTGALLEGNEQDNIAVANPLLASQISAGGGNDQLWGNDFTNTLLDGWAGDDILRGGHGANILRGGRGDDTFVVNHKDTLVEELPNQGTDTVWVTVDGWNGVLAGGDYYEVVRLVDDARSATLGGNGVQAVANVLGSTITITGRGNNQFYGQGGADSFTGGAGDDIFRAGTGITRMEGGLGNDQYVIKNLASTAIERAGEGYDTAWVAVEGWTVAENIEVAYLSGAAVTITGNASGVNLVANPTAASTLIAGTGLTYFWGSAFADTMRIGAGGGDVYLRGGADRMEFGAHWGSVQVSDFSQAEGDKLDFSRSGLTRADLAVTQFGDKALIEHAGEQIILYGVTALAAGDLVF